jgi:methyltransferase (TIGR00027 family)
MMVALWRAYGDFGLTSVPNFSDASARKLLDGRTWQLLLRQGEALRHKPEPWKAGMRPYLDLIILRVAFIDAIVAQVRAPQVVILGAGLDTRAWRLEALRDAHVFEVDYPSTQRYKRERAPRLGAPLAQLTFVPVDFGQGAGASSPTALERSLAEAGHDASSPTLWIWEGVIMYLDDSALRSTLGAIHRRSAPGSRLVAHYHEPHVERGALRLRKLLFSWIGEPQIGLRSSATMLAELTRAGFQVDEDADLDAQAQRVGGSKPIHPRGLISRIAVARLA